tara:strand:+ start:6160 stop:6294 length:135 start_codon:yes stop_codon:yes gene_type:complete
MRNIKLENSRSPATVVVTRNDYDGEIPDQHDASLFIFLRKETPG